LFHHFFNFSLKIGLPSFAFTLAFATFALSTFAFSSSFLLSSHVSYHFIDLFVKHISNHTVELFSAEELISIHISTGEKLPHFLFFGVWILLKPYLFE